MMMSRITDLMRDIGHRPVLYANEERDLVARANGDDREAREELVRRNIGLVLMIADKMPRSYLRSHCDDLVSAGLWGLIEAIDRYDVGQGARLSTYACYWIKRYMVRAIQEDFQLVRVPKYLWDAMVLRKQGKPFLRKKNTERYLDHALVAMSFRARGLLGALPEDDDTSKLVGSGGGDPEAVDAAMDRGYLVAVTRSAVKALEPRDAEIVRLLHGLGGKPPMNRAEVGRRFGLTRERIRQIETKALAELAEILEFSMKGVA